jgi:hypothetical protein
MGTAGGPREVKAKAERAIRHVPTCQCDATNNSVKPLKMRTTPKNRRIVSLRCFRQFSALALAGKVKWQGQDGAVN